MDGETPLPAGDPTPDDGLDPGLQAAFGVARADSVLRRLAPSGDPLRAVLLRDEAESRPPVLPLRGAGTEGRYQVMGEIARGGVGVILKGHDVDLGRDVAMKVLRPEHAGRDEIVQRFVEEAQIGGQLQHPGIVPVYEMGLGKDRRPYFTMKLVKGRTLASLLAGLRDLAAERGRLLKIFESVCHTMAYAHARGVIHRDLKPANVMVGAFGEVLVVDWGMGKVLREGGVADEERARARPPEQSVIATVRSGGSGAHSEVGSLMGTPAYMPPEQARGDVERMDERSDVFSLGAILCELLSGQPPYSGSDELVIGQAVRAQLDDAFARLDAAGADAELVQLAKACLAPALEARPRDASAVASEMAGYLTSLERRRKEAEARESEAQVRVEEERKRRKLSMALAASVLGLVVLGGGGWVWVEGQRRERAEVAARGVTAALDEATTQRALAEAADPDAALPLWREAVSAGRRAAELAKGSDVAPAARERAHALLATLEAAHGRAGARAEERHRDAALIERLDEIRGRHAETMDWKEAEAAYAAALAPHLGADAGAADAAGAVARLAGSKIRARLIVALDEWMQTRIATKQSNDGLRAVLAQVDEDPWRRRLREAKDLDALRALAGAANLDATPLESVLLLANRLGWAGDADRALAVALAVVDRYPGDFWTCNACATWASKAQPPRPQDARRFATAAVALRPGSWWAHLNLGAAHREGDDILGAVAETRAALRLRPDPLGYMNLASHLAAADDLDGAMAAAREGLRLDPENAGLKTNLAASLSGKGEHDAALALVQDAVRRTPVDAEVQYILGCVLRDRGDLVEAAAAWREAIRLRVDGRDHAALAGALERLGRLDEALVAAREAVRLEGAWAGARQTLGRLLRETGALREALEHLKEAVRLEPARAEHHRQMGLCLEYGGDWKGAAAAFRSAIRLDAKSASARMNLGSSLGALGDVEGQLAETRAAVRLDPTHAQARTNLGSILLDRGETAAGVAELREAIRLDPHLAEPHVNLAEHHRKRGALDEAHTEASTAVKLNPRLPNGHVVLAMIAEARGDAETAVRKYREALEVAPRDLVLRHNHGIFLYRRGDYAGAAEQFREALRIDPTHPNSHVGLVHSLLPLDRWDERLAALRAALAALPVGGSLADARRQFENALPVAVRHAAMAEHVPAALAGTFRPTSAADASALAWIHYRTARHAASTRMYEEALRLDPRALDLDADSNRYNAACAAALAGGAEGADAATSTPVDRTRWRALARAWLRDVLRLPPYAPDADPAGLRMRLEHWQKDPDLAVLRDESKVGALSPTEQAECRALWRDVAALLEKAKAAVPPRGS